tara:strand:+ start:111 stop:509 length:399 start_codon:yes stop_codon:yes gene_type:complete
MPINSKETMMRNSMRLTSERIQDWKDETKLFCWGVFAIVCYLAWKVVCFLRLGTYKVQQLWPEFTTCYWRFRDFRHGVEECGRCYNEFQMREADEDVALELAAELDDYIISLPAGEISDDAELAEMPDDPRW